jgi:hypothetical protein
MSSPLKQVDAFDQEYRDRVRDAVWKAIIDATRDPRWWSASERRV